MKTQFQGKTRFLTECALFAAFMCICSPITIPIGPIPVTLGIFAVMLCGVMLGWMQALASVGVYLLIGLCGLPLFSGGNSGLTAIAGPTGGYIWSYLIMAPVIALLSKHRFSRRWQSVAAAFMACIAGIVVCYFCGTLQFTQVAGYSWGNALAVCVYPFIGFDLIKALCASALGVLVRERLRAGGIVLS